MTEKQKKKVYYDCGSGPESKKEGEKQMLKGWGASLASQRLWPNMGNQRRKGFWNVKGQHTSDLWALAGRIYETQMQTRPDILTEKQSLETKSGSKRQLKTATLKSGQLQWLPGHIKLIGEQYVYQI